MSLLWTPTARIPDGKIPKDSRSLDIKGVSPLLMIPAGTTVQTHFPEHIWPKLIAGKLEEISKHSLQDDTFVPLGVFQFLQTTVTRLAESMSQLPRHKINPITHSLSAIGTLYCKDHTTLPAQMLFFTSADGNASPTLFPLIIVQK
jgi:hypothetical protein